MKNMGWVAYRPQSMGMASIFLIFFFSNHNKTTDTQGEKEDGNTIWTASHMIFTTTTTTFFPSSLLFLGHRDRIGRERKYEWIKGKDVLYLERAKKKSGGSLNCWPLPLPPPPGRFVAKGRSPDLGGHETERSRTARRLHHVH